MGIYKRAIGCFLFAVIFAVIVAISFKSAEAASFIIEDGKPNAEIVVSKDAPRVRRLAALELQYYLRKMSGARLPIVFKVTEKYPYKIYVGESEYTKKLGVNNKGLKYGAFHIRTGPDYMVFLGNDFDFQPKIIFVRWDKETEEYTNVKLDSLPEKTKQELERLVINWWNPNNVEQIMSDRYGADNQRVWNPKGIEWRRYYSNNGDCLGYWIYDQGGSLNAVYGYLRSLGVEWYMPGDLGEVIPEQKSIAMPAKDITSKPDFAMRYWLYYKYMGYSYDDTMWTRRLGMNATYELYGYPGGGGHGLTKVIDSKELQEKHPEYYALIGGNRDNKRKHPDVCHSSKGLITQCVKYARFVFGEYDLKRVSFMPSDGFRKCGCDKCKDKTPSDLVWGFIDKIARELYKTHPDRLVACGAYTSYAKPPESIEKFSPNVSISINNMGRPLFDNPEIWKEYWSQIEGWKKRLGPKRIHRVENNRYSLNGMDKNGKIKFPVIHPRAMAKDLSALNGICIGEVDEVSVSLGRWAAPGCDHLHLYVESRFLWDADQDVEPMLTEYYEKFYGPVSKEMRDALEFAQNNYSRTSPARGGRINPIAVSLPVRIKLAELLNSAHEKAGDTIYGKRIKVLIDELTPLEKLRQELAEKKKLGNPRDHALEIEAHKLNTEAAEKLYKLPRRLVMLGERPDVDTHFTVNWTEKSLAFNIRCEEPDMKKIKVGENVWDGDSLVLLLESPYHSYYQVEVAPDGRVFDADRFGAGRVIPRWKSMADVKIEKAKDYWTAKITIPIALVGEEGAEGDPFHYVVSSRIKPGQEWFFTIGRRRPREGSVYSLKKTYVLSAGGRNIWEPSGFAKLIFK